MKIAFFGTPPYAVPTLDALVEAGHEVVTVIAQPDRKVGRGRKLRSPATVVRARELGITTRQPRAIRSGPFAKNYPALDVDLAVVVAYGRILPAAILDAPRLGSINGHGSLLPRWRGAAPIEWAVISGDAETGVCSMVMEEGLDTGPVLLCRRTPIGPDETAGELRARLSVLTAEAMVETVARIEELEPQPQPAEGVTHAEPLTKGHARVDWTLASGRVAALVRGTTPRPGAWTTLRGERFKLHAVRLVDGDGAPGEVLEAGKRLVVACGSGALEVITGQLPNRKAQPARDLVNGSRLQVGEVMS